MGGKGEGKGGEKKGGDGGKGKEGEGKEGGGKGLGGIEPNSLLNLRGIDATDYLLCVITITVILVIKYVRVLIRVMIFKHAAEHFTKSD